MHNNLQITYADGQPKGIRDENGYLFFFTTVTKYPNQENRYQKELAEQRDLADYLLKALQNRKAE